MSAQAVLSPARTREKSYYLEQIRPQQRSVPTQKTKTSSWIRSSGSLIVEVESSEKVFIVNKNAVFQVSSCPNHGFYGIPVWRWNMRHLVNQYAALQTAQQKSGVLAIDAIVREADEVDRQGRDDDSVDLIFNYFDTLLRKSEFAVINQYLEFVDEERYTTDVLVSILTITAPARDLLNKRVKVLENTRKLIQVRKEPEEDLLVGL